MREFATGATRDVEEGKNDYRGFVSPQAMRRFGDYMTEHRKQADGKLRDSDNWKKGIPQKAYLSSLIRHVFDLHFALEYVPATATFGDPLAQRFGEPPTAKVVEDLLCAVIFNAQGLLHERLLGRDVGAQPEPVQFDIPLAWETYIRTRAANAQPGTDPGAILAHLTCGMDADYLRNCHFYEDFQKAMAGVQK